MPLILVSAQKTLKNNYTRNIFGTKFKEASFLCPSFARLATAHGKKEGFHTTVVKFSPIDDLLNRTLQNELRMEQEMERLAVVPYVRDKYDVGSLAEESETSSGYEESFP